MAITRLTGKAWNRPANAARQAAAVASVRMPVSTMVQDPPSSKAHTLMKARDPPRGMRSQ